MKNVILNKMRNKRCKEQKIHVDLAKTYNIIVYIHRTRFLAPTVMFGYLQLKTRAPHVEALYPEDELSIGILYHSWLSKTPIMVSRNLIGFKLMSRQGFYVPGHCDLDL